MAGFSTATRNAMMDAIRTALDAGSGTTGATLNIYTATRPASGAAITSQTLLGTLTCSSSCASAASNGTITFNTITQDSAADASGTATWGRAFNKSGTFVMDFSVGTSGAELNLSNNVITAGGPISISSMSITDGNP